MMIGLVGAPNKGKSTLFSAMTTLNVAIASYPFTTIAPNKGAAYATAECPDKSLNLKCKPHNSLCVNGTRFVPVEVIDVAGLVPGAHLGKGMGNQFLNDLMQADMLVQVIDASGKTDINGNQTEGSDPVEEVRMVREELVMWMVEIIKRHAKKLAAGKDKAEALAELLGGFRVDKKEINSALERSSLSLHISTWKESEIKNFASEMIKASKPMIVAANKVDSASDEMITKIREGLSDFTVIECSGAIELALKKAGKEGIIDYTSGERSFSTLKEASEEKRNGLKFMEGFLKKRSTGVQEVINTAVFNAMNCMVVYPVEDEYKYTDHFGNVLPDAVLVKGGSTASDLARKIHTELAAKMLYAVDARKKMRIAKDYELRNNDIIKIISAAR